MIILWKLLGKLLALPDILTDAVDIQFFIKDESDTTHLQAALLIHRDLVKAIL